MALKEIQEQIQIVKDTADPAIKNINAIHCKDKYSREMNRALRNYKIMLVNRMSEANIHSKSWWPELEFTRREQIHFNTINSPLDGNINLTPDNVLELVFDFAWRECGFAKRELYSIKTEYDLRKEIIWYYNVRTLLPYAGISSVISAYTLYLSMISGNNNYRIISVLNAASLVWATAKILSSDEGMSAKDLVREMLGDAVQGFTKGAACALLCQTWMFNKISKILHCANLSLALGNLAKKGINLDTLESVMSSALHYRYRDGYIVMGLLGAMERVAAGVRNDIPKLISASGLSIQLNHNSKATDHDAKPEPDDYIKSNIREISRNAIDIRNAHTADHPMMHTKLPINRVDHHNNHDDSVAQKVIESIKRKLTNMKDRTQMQNRVINTTSQDEIRMQRYQDTSPDLMSELIFQSPRTNISKTNSLHRPRLRSELPPMEPYTGPLFPTVPKELMHTVSWTRYRWHHVGHV